MLGDTVSTDGVSITKSSFIWDNTDSKKKITELPDKKIPIDGMQPVFVSFLTFSLILGFRWTEIVLHHPSVLLVVAVDLLGAVRSEENHC